MKTDQFNLNRFIEAHEHVYQSVLSELRQGQKTGHWMWFIFPQIRGLGRSPISQQFAIQNLAEAAAYLAHPVLGKRLIECTQALLALENRSAEDIFGYPDCLKLRSSLTLFEKAAGGNNVFSQAIEKYFQGRRDERTLEILGTSQA